MMNGRTRAGGARATGGYGVRCIRINTQKGYFKAQPKSVSCIYSDINATTSRKNATKR